MPFLSCTPFKSLPRCWGNRETLNYFAINSIINTMKRLLIYSFHVSFQSQTFNANWNLMLCTNQLPLHVSQLTIFVSEVSNNYLRWILIHFYWIFKGSWKEFLEFNCFENFIEKHQLGERSEGNIQGIASGQCYKIRGFLDFARRDLDIPAQKNLSSIMTRTSLGDIGDVCHQARLKTCRWSSPHEGYYQAQARRKCAADFDKMALSSSDQTTFLDEMALNRLNCVLSELDSVGLIRAWRLLEETRYEP